MNKRQRAALAVGVAAATVVVAAPVASAATIKDERSNGSMYEARTYAACDISQLEAETAGGTLQVTVTTRGAANPGASLSVDVDTRGGNGTPAEFVARGEDLSTGGSGAQRQVGRVTTSVSGRQLVITIPLSAAGAPRRVGVQVRTCGEGAIDVAPGPDSFDRDDSDFPRRYLFATPAERVVEGTVDLLCAASGRSCSRLPVEGTSVRAVGGSPRRTYETATDARGRFALGVEKGTYTVTATDNFLQVRSGARRVDVTKRRRGSAAFTACGVKAASARAAAVGGGLWRGGNADCLNYFEIAWRPSTGMTVTWASAPRCTGVGGNRVGLGKVLLKESFVNPQAQGTNLLVGADDIRFHLPIQSVHSGNNVNGTLRANGSGLVNAKYVEGLCTFGIGRLALKRG